MPHRLRVCDVMTRDVITLSEDDTLDDARASMERAGVRHLPVLDEERLIGLVTHRDLLAASFSVLRDGSAREEHELFCRTPVREIMHDAIAVAPDTPLGEAARMMLDSKFGCLPVIDADGNLQGILTEADFLRLTVRIIEAIHA